MAGRPGSRRRCPQKSLHPRQCENEGSKISHARTQHAPGLASSFALPAKWDRSRATFFQGSALDPDEHLRRDIRTPGFKPRSRLPTPANRCSGCLMTWESVTRYRGGTVPESHGVPATPMVSDMWPHPRGAAVQRTRSVGGRTAPFATGFSDPFDRGNRSFVGPLPPAGASLHRRLRAGGLHQPT